MAIFRFHCSCGHVFRKLLPEAVAAHSCPRCKLEAPREARGASATVYETLDGGLQARATVRIADAQRIFKEREIENDALVGSDFLDDDEAEKIDDVGELL